MILLYSTTVHCTEYSTGTILRYYLRYPINSNQVVAGAGRHSQIGTVAAIPAAFLPFLTMPHRLLAGDIGGTNSRLVLYESAEGPLDASDFSTILSHRVVAQHYYKNHEFQSFTEVLCAFTAAPAVQSSPIDSCCLATAGPVSNNRINFTNREGWIIDGRVIREEFGIRHVQLVNDFVAAGYGLLGLDASEVHTLQEGSARLPFDDGDGDSAGGGVGAAEGAPKALVGAGTGLGECFLTPDDSGVYRAFATEGGHVEFAPRTELEEDLLHYLQEKLDLPQPAEGDRARVSVERVVSGKGLENIYEFLRQKYPDQVDAVLNEEYNSSAERGRLMGAQKYNYTLFRQAFEIMMGIYGGEVGNAALKYLPFAGLYVAGGIAPKNLECMYSTKHSQMLSIPFIHTVSPHRFLPDF